MGKKSHNPKREAAKKEKKERKCFRSLYKVEWSDAGWQVPSKIIDALSRDYVLEKKFTPDMPLNTHIPRIQYPNFRSEVQILFAKVIYHIQFHPYKVDVLELMNSLHEKFNLKGEALLWSKEVREVYDKFWKKAQIVGPIFQGIFD